MDHETFIQTVQHDAEIGWDEAERATQAVLQTLADRIVRGEARDLAAQLPAEVAPHLAKTTEAAERLDIDQFLGRIAERAGVDLTTAERYARAVFDALSRAVSPGEWDDLVAELPSQYAPLLPRGPDVDVPSLEIFVQKVIDHSGLDKDAARRATEAVLEALAERIAGGEVDDLINRLPVELHDPLKRGKEHTGGKATRMSVDEFVERVAELEGVDLFAAREHTRAVFLALRESVGADEFADITSELPGAYLEALAV